MTAMGAPMPRSLNFVPLALLLSFSMRTPATAQSAAPHLSDPEVAHVAVTANSIDIELATLAKSRTGNHDVKQFASTMITDHGAVNAKAKALAGKLHVTPKDNDVSQSLLKGAAEARAKIEPLKGKEFDRAYIDREVAYHQAVLDALDKVLIPSTSNAALKQLLVDVRPAFAAHLQHAKELQGQLVAGR
jgi:putative membrane protein